MSILVIAEHDGVNLHATTPHTVAAAVELAFLAGCDVHVLVAGYRCDQIAVEATEISGVMKVIQVDGPHHTRHEVAPVLAIAPEHGHILFPATPLGTNFAMRVAAALRVKPICDVNRIVSVNAFEQHCVADEAHVINTDSIKVITVFAAGFQPACRFGHAGIEVLDIRQKPGSRRLHGAGTEVAVGQWC